MPVSAKLHQGFDALHDALQEAVPLPEISDEEEEEEEEDDELTDREHLDDDPSSEGAEESDSDLDEDSDGVEGSADDESGNADRTLVWTEPGSKPMKRLSWSWFQKDQRDDAGKGKRQEDFSRSIQVAVLGSPNAGKSTLVNALLQDERLIVSPIAGTTMDSIVVDTSLGPDSHPVRLIDTCGIYKGWRTQPAPGQTESFHLLSSSPKAQTCIRLFG